MLRKLEDWWTWQKQFITRKHNENTFRIVTNMNGIQILHSRQKVDGKFLFWQAQWLTVYCNFGGLEFWFKIKSSRPRYIVIFLRSSSEILGQCFKESNYHFQIIYKP
jgi:hypothetical protein